MCFLLIITVDIKKKKKKGRCNKPKLRRGFTTQNYLTRTVNHCAARDFIYICIRLYEAERGFAPKSAAEL